jgi:hypothetical protein
MAGYNPLSTVKINDFEIGICPVCNRRLTAECEHRSEESELWYAAQILAEHTLANELWHKKHADPRTAEQIAMDEWQAETEATRESDYPV